MPWSRSLFQRRASADDDEQMIPGGQDAALAARNRSDDRATCETGVMLWPQASVLKSDRFSLEPLAAQHAVEMVTVLASPGLYRFTGGQPPAPDELRARYERQSRGESQDGSAGWLNWIIRPLSGGPATGYVQVTLTREKGDLVADIAWLVAEAGQGCGVATETAGAVVAWLPSIGTRRVQALIHPDHTASARVAQRLGLAQTPTLVDGERLWQAALPLTDSGVNVIR